MKNMSLSFKFLMGAILLTGCSNAFSTYYHSFVSPENLNQSLDETSLAVPPHLIVAAGNMDAEGQSLLENGYGLVGASNFNGAEVNSTDALKIAHSVSASIVVVGRKFSNTISGMMPVQTPQTQTVYQSYNGMVGGNSFMGTGTSTIYGTQTNYIPYTVNRFDYVATYWAKLRPSTFKVGIHFKELDDNAKRLAGTNRGIQILAVVKGTPAYEADLLKDDIVLDIDGKRVDDSQTAAVVIKEITTRVIKFDIVRDGKPLKKTLVLQR